MYRTLIAVLFAAGLAFSLDTLAYPNSFVDSAIIEANDFNENDSTAQRYTKNLTDSIDAKFVRFSDLNNGDSTLRKLKVDTIQSNPKVDSARIGYATADTAKISTFLGVGGSSAVTAGQDVQIYGSATRLHMRSADGANRLTFSDAVQTASEYYSYVFGYASGIEIGDTVGTDHYIKSADRGWGIDTQATSPLKEGLHINDSTFIYHPTYIKQALTTDSIKACGYAELDTIAGPKYVGFECYGAGLRPATPAVGMLIAVNGTKDSLLCYLGAAWVIVAQEP